MIKLAQNSRESQEHRLKIKTLNQPMQNVAVHGTGLSPWEAKVLVEAIEHVYFTDPALRQASDGQLKYSCPGVTHRGIAVRLWLGGKESVEIARHINHSIAAVENYLEKFKRVAYLRRKSFDDYQSALTIGISVAAVKTFVQLYKQYQHKPFFKQRIDEIELVGSQYYVAQDEKKDSISPSGTYKGGMSR